MISDGGDNLWQQRDNGDAQVQLRKDSETKIKSSNG